MKEDQQKRKVAKVATTSPKNNSTLNPIYHSSPHGYAIDASSNNGGSSRNNIDASLDPVISQGNKIVTAYDYDHYYHHGALDYEEDAYLDSFPAGYRIYKKLDRSLRASTRPRVQVVQDHQTSENGMLLPEESKQIPMPTMAGNYSQGNEMVYLNTNAAYAPAYHLNGIGTVITESFDSSQFELPYCGNAVHPRMGTAGASSPSSSYMQSYISDEHPIDEYLHYPKEFFAAQRMDNNLLPPLNSFSPFPYEEHDDSNKYQC
ncbi:hypothetical protein GH714_003190 [Hevea brasiliensis]|uniref:Uncharacterized protein n=1 Tax=Hevea brasiliensis TaxID=3981 RepID=A0A6A6LEA9_HEVBR|nr:hypothetical protein GH714_003190 [Hevea brasiliensis]